MGSSKTFWQAAQPKLGFNFAWPTLICSSVRFIPACASPLADSSKQLNTVALLPRWQALLYKVRRSVMPGLPRKDLEGVILHPTSRCGSWSLPSPNRLLATPQRYSLAWMKSRTRVTRGNPTLQSFAPIT
jgi:hypothetical protein